jgi:hypothetical protein
VKTTLLLAPLLPALLALAAPAYAVSFSQADQNHDGVVSLEEAERAFPRMSQTLIDKADHNDDGYIDKGEFPSLNSIDRFENQR